MTGIPTLRSRSQPRPRRPFCACATAIALTALVAAPAALAHVTTSPAFVEIGVSSTVSFETPNERPSHATTSLVLEAPPGVELEPGDPPDGWSVEATDDTVRWTGGRIEGERIESFPVVVTADPPAGIETFRAVQGYDDGESVHWETRLTVLPASAEAQPKQRFGRALAAGAAGLAVLVGSLFVVRRLRRRPLQEE